MTTITPARGQRVITEGAAEALRRPRVRTRYARTTTALVHSVRSGAAVTVVLTATVIALAVATFR